MVGALGVSDDLDSAYSYQIYPMKNGQFQLLVVGLSVHFRVNPC